MRIYQVLVIGSFVALAACRSEDTVDASAPPVQPAPANDQGAIDRGAVDEHGRPIGATDPITPSPEP